MPFATSSIDCAPKIEAHWPTEFMPITEDAQKIIDAFSDAFKSSVSVALGSVVINGGMIVGGTAPPGGPVVGAVLSIPPGTIVSSPPNLESVYVPPTFVNDGGPGSYTDWHSHLVADVSSCLSQAWTTWMTTWSLAGGVALGGVAAWISSVPPTGGPWSAGTITPFTFLGQGLNASPAISLFGESVASTASADYVTPEDAESCTVYSDVSSPIIDAITAGMKETLLQTLQTVLVKDPVGSSAFGAVAPGGIVVTGSISGMVLDVI